MDRPRKSDTHKGDYGKVLVISGYVSYNDVSMIGAPLLVGKATLRAGAGLVTVSSFDRTYRGSFGFEDTLVGLIGNVPELMYKKLSVKLLMSSNDYDAIAIGPGISKGAKQKTVLKKLLISYDGKLIIDADGLNNISENEPLKNLLFKRKSETILTPHKMEAERLFGGEDEIRKVCHQNENIVVILKGFETKVFHKDKCEKIRAGNPGMATAGSGDVLTGIVTALSAQKSPIEFSAFEAAVSAVKLHGEAGNRALETHSERSLIATDIIENLR